MESVERWNRQQIEGLNQRGGRTLSIVDLLLAGTIDVETAAHVGEAVGRGASFLTAANPGGAGKTALLAALLGFLPAGVPIVTVDRPNVIAAARETGGPGCYLAHEIGSGHWHGYIWGPVVGLYLDLAARGHMVASCLHADTTEEVQDALHACTIGDPLVALKGIDFVLFMHVEKSPAGYRRWVAGVYERDGTSGTYEPAFLWDPSRDCCERLGGNPNTRALSEFLRELAERGIREFGEVRSAYVDFIQGAG